MEWRNLVLPILSAALALSFADPASACPEADALKALGDLRPEIKRDQRGIIWSLDLSERNLVRDEALTHIGCFQNLTELYLIYTPLTGEGFANLKQLTKLRRLDLYGCTLVTDAGIRHLKHLGNLEYLDLTGTKITDRGLASLAGLKKLKTLRLGDTAVSAVGVARFQQALPKVEVER